MNVHNTSSHSPGGWWIGNNVNLKLTIFHFLPCRTITGAFFTAALAATGLALL